MSVTDQAGRTFTRAESTRLISQASPVPVYAMHEPRQGHGILGGLLLERREPGEQSAEMALKVLAGLDPASLPVAFQPLPCLCGPSGPADLGLAARPAGRSGPAPRRCGSSYQ